MSSEKAFSVAVRWICTVDFHKLLMPVFSHQPLSLFKLVQQSWIHSTGKNLTRVFLKSQLTTHLSNHRHLKATNFGFWSIQCPYWLADVWEEHWFVLGATFFCSCCILLTAGFLLCKIFLMQESLQTSHRWDNYPLGKRCSRPVTTVYYSSFIFPSISFQTTFQKKKLFFFLLWGSISTG